MRLAGLALVAAALATAPPATAVAQSRFLEPMPLAGASIDGDGGNHALAMDSGGAGVALWGGTLKIRASLRAPTGPFGPPLDVDPDDGSATAEPELEVAPDGRVIAVWRGPDDNFPPLSQAWVAVKPPGATTFSEPLQVSTETFNVPCICPRVALLPDGRAVIVWIGRNNAMASSAQVRRRTVSVAGVPEGTPGNVSGLNVDFPDVETGANGAMLVTWRTEADTITGDQGTAYYTPGSDIADLQTLNTNSGAVAEALVDPAGNALLLNRTGTSLIALTRAAGAGQDFGDAETVNPAGQLGSQPVIAQDAAGNVTAAYSLTEPGPDRTLQVATRPAGLASEFGPPLPLDAPTLLARMDIDLDVNASGAALLSWRDDTDDSVHAAARPAGGAFGPPTASLVAAGRVGGVSRAALDASGRGIVTVTSRPAAPDPFSVDVIPFDDVPRAAGLQVPATGVAGEPLTFAVAPQDPWAPVTGVNWNFGDGASSTGAQVQHSYGQPGTYAVRLTLTDDLGNSTLTERPVVVSQERRAPRISGARMLRKRFRAGRRPTPRSSAKAGSAFLFTLDERADVLIRIERKLPGRRVRGQCVRPRRANRGRRRCTRHVRRGSLRRPGLAAGANRVAFSGRIGSRKLPPGAYRARISATDAVGNTGRAVILAFRITRR